MKELILLRHAKSSWDDPSLEDFDRPLAPRGKKAAPLMGRTVAQRGWLPDLVLVSAARRTRQTWRLVSAELRSESSRVTHEEALYMASPEQLLTAIRAVPKTTRRLMLIGHNPGLEMLARNLASPDSDAGALDRMQNKFPTTALARFTVNGSWKNLGPGGAQLTHFLRPKELS